VSLAATAVRFSPLPAGSLPYFFPLLSSLAVVAIVVVVASTVCYYSSSSCFAPLPQKLSQYRVDSPWPSFLIVVVAICSSLSLSLSLARRARVTGLRVSGMERWRRTEKGNREQRRSRVWGSFRWNEVSPAFVFYFIFFFFYFVIGYYYIILLYLKPK